MNAHRLSFRAIISYWSGLLSPLSSAQKLFQPVFISVQERFKIDSRIKPPLPSPPKRRPPKDAAEPACKSALRSPNACPVTCIFNRASKTVFPSFDFSAVTGKPIGSPFVFHQ
jgi:hypothetical protein